MRASLEAPLAIIGNLTATYRQVIASCFPHKNLRLARNASFQEIERMAKEYKDGIWGEELNEHNTVRRQEIEI